MRNVLSWRIRSRDPAAASCPSAISTAISNNAPTLLVGAMFLILLCRRCSGYRLFNVTILRAGLSGTHKTARDPKRSCRAASAPFRFPQPQEALATRHQRTADHLLHHQSFEACADSSIALPRTATTLSPKLHP